MDFTELREAAHASVAPDAWNFYQGTADGNLDRDSRAWAQWDLIPRVMTGLTAIDTTVTLGGDTFASPIMLAPSAAHGAATADGERATHRAAEVAGMLVGYSFNATEDVESFAASATSPWWAQVYPTMDRAASDSFLRRCVSAGARAVVLTVDIPGILADTPFRRAPLAGRVIVRGNHSAFASIPGALVAETSYSPDEIGRTAGITGLPVWAKGIMTADDARRAIDAGAAGIIVSNHGRRQLAGVAPTASVLREIVLAVEGRAPVLVDGGIRSGTDVVRALALGASAVGIGRPVLWGLAAGGDAVLGSVLETLNDEVRVAMAGLGAATVADLVPEMVRAATAF